MYTCYLECEHGDNKDLPQAKCCMHISTRNGAKLMIGAHALSEQ